MVPGALCFNLFSLMRPFRASVDTDSHDGGHGTLSETVRRV